VLNVVCKRGYDKEMIEGAVKLVRNDWESQFFDREIYRLEWQRDLAFEELQRSLRNAPRVDLFEASLPAERLDSLAVLTGAGFWVADILVDFEASASYRLGLSSGGEVTIAVATEADLAGLLDTCLSLHFGSRYYRPPFLDEDGRRYYSRWTENAVRGQFDDICFIARKDGHIASLACARRMGLDAVRIGLIGTKAADRRSGTTEMVWERVASWAQSMGRNRLFVQTQLGNSHAIQFYGEMGGRIRSSRIHTYYSPAS
jgi:dTDP-4-amino-4,6-dideoxy-D-galactose acyltransferase